MRKHAFFFMVFVIAQTSCVSLLQPAEFSGFQKFVSNTLPVSFAWSYESVEPVRVPPRANHEVMVLLQTDGVFVALDIETGAVRWEYDMGGKIGHAPYPPSLPAASRAPSRSGLHSQPGFSRS